jgi:peptide methionine sulfoxide reductase MsrB
MHNRRTNETGGQMEKVLIDTFIVPEESKAEFLEGARKVERFIGTLPGFVEGFLYEKKDGESRCNFLTTAVWESEEAFEIAKGLWPSNFKSKVSISKKRPND